MTPLRLSLLAFGTFLLGLFVATVVRPVSPDERIWLERVLRYQKDSVAFEQILNVLHGSIAIEKARADSAERQAIAHKAVADQFRVQSNHFRVRADSAIAKLDSAKTAADSVPILVTALDARTAEATELRASNVSLSEAFDAQKQATARLTAVVDTQNIILATMTKRLAVADELLKHRPASDRCRVLWWGCPSRTVTAIAGAVVGFAGGVYVAVR